ncbi:MULTISPECIES: hypothetical protein [Mycolicibacterium]|nr:MULTISPECIES: hypothetical protein [Mycolicibacterium]
MRNGQRPNLDQSARDALDDLGLVELVDIAGSGVDAHHAEEVTPA